VTCPAISVATEVRLDNPLKQGLKLAAPDYTLLLYPVRLDNPLKQGLKLGRQIADP